MVYTTYISVDLAHHEIFCAKVGKGGIKDFSRICFVSGPDPLTRKTCFTIVKPSLCYQKCVYNVQTMFVCVC